ncbi:hypothetical protein WAF17_00220 [Bernardetia sp. ABR2-2B]|uniref:hypothetical protein n=1 Tax=Bernardetia sp. ABR2-2B TaxID=3127472 RepID=UPI0030CFE518
MKTLILFFILLIPLFSYTEEKMIDTKCCEHHVEIKEKYLEGGFEYKKHYNILGRRKDNATSFTVFHFISKGNEEIKFITELGSDSIKDMSVRMANRSSNLEKDKIDERIKYPTYELSKKTKVLDSKRNETKFQTLKKGLYFIHFYGKNQKSHCGSSASFVRKMSKKEVEEAKSKLDPNVEIMIAQEKK